MSIRNLDALFKPGAIALIGASADESSVGGVLARNLVNSGFDGPVMPVNPHRRHVGGVIAYPTVDELPMVPDLGIVATPPETVPGIVAALGRKGARGAIVISAGFGESRGREGKALEKAILTAAKPHLLRLVGPNCLGIIVPGVGLNASFAHLTPAQGRLAFVTQSGAVVASVIDWAQNHGVGFSHLVSLGDMADVDFGDMLDYLANDPGTRAIRVRAIPGPTHGAVWRRVAMAHLSGSASMRRSSRASSLVTRRSRTTIRLWMSRRAQASA